MPRAIVYGRVSSDKQKESGAGENAQGDDCAAWCARNGYELVGPFVEEEGISGASALDRRPKLLEAIAELRKGDVLLVARRDRLGRDPIKVAMIEEEVRRRKCRVVSAAGEGTDDDEPESILMRRILDAFAEFERFKTKIRTKTAAAAKRRRLLRVGQTPYGWEPDPSGPTSKKTGKLLRVRQAADEQEVLKRIRAWRDGGWSLRRIAEALNHEGLPTKRGTGPDGRWSGRWTHSTIDSVIRSAEHWKETNGQGSEETGAVDQ